MKLLRRIARWLAVNLPETRATPHLMAFGWRLTDYKRER